MSLTIKEVQHVALLARIAMTDEDAAAMCDQLSHILDQFKILDGVDTESVHPTGHSAKLETVLRDDKSSDSSPRNDVLLNVPETEGDFVRIKSVFK